MVEQELERLRQVVDRLTDAHQEAIEVIDRVLEYRGEQTFRESEHLEETLVDVREILGGASMDVRDLSEGPE